MIEWFALYLEAVMQVLSIGALWLMAIVASAFVAFVLWAAAAIAWRGKDDSHQ